MFKRKIQWILILSLIITIFATGCSKTNEEDNRLKIYTSFYPMYDFTLKIAQDKVNVINMVPSGIEPHDWEPSASDIISLEKADMFVYNGAGMEHWVDDVLSSLSNKELIVVEASKGIELLKGDRDHGHKGLDSHVWTAPLNVKVEMENIKNALISLDPENTSYYEENYETFSKELDELDKEFKDTINKLPNKDIVVSHEAFSYMSDAYGLNQIAIDGLTPDSEPNPGRMAEIIDFVKEKDIKVIFFEEMASPKVAKTIADATGAGVDVLNPLEGLTDEEIGLGEDYFSVMRKNLGKIEQALK